MIVYFFKKSKDNIKKWGIGVLACLSILYASFVWSKMLISQKTTLQIVRKFDTSIQKTDISEIKTGQLDNSVSAQEYLYVASKRGKYYYPKNCSRARTLSVQNMLYFKDKIEAEQAGYIAHTGC